MKRLSHAHWERLFVRQFLFTESNGAAGHHQTLASLVLQLGHLSLTTISAFWSFPIVYQLCRLSGQRLPVRQWRPIDPMPIRIRLLGWWRPNLQTHHKGLVGFKLVCTIGSTDLIWWQHVWHSSNDFEEQTEISTTVPTRRESVSPSKIFSWLSKFEMLSF